MRAGPAARASPCSSSSTTRKAARTTCCTATPASETSCPRLVTAQAYENRHMRWSRSTSTARAPASGASCASSKRAACRSPCSAWRWRCERYPELAGRVHGTAATRSPATACAGSTTRTCPRPPSASTCGVATQIIRELTGGEWPLGWYTGRDSPNTRRLVVDHGGYEYDSDYYGDDLPFWTAGAKSDGSAGAAPGRAVHAGHQRHALRAAAGLQHRRPLLHLPARQLRRAVRRRRRGARR